MERRLKVALKEFSENSEKHIHTVLINEELITEILSKYTHKYPTLRIDKYKYFEVDRQIERISAVAGPTVTLFEIIHARGMRISKIKSLEEDISLALSALGIRIIAPMPGKGTIEIEVPNQRPEIVSLRSVIDTAVFRASSFDLAIALGKTMKNKPFIIDPTGMPHLLMAGATGQGKSVGLNVIISSLLFKRFPGELQFVLIDPKRVEFSMFNDIKDKYLYNHPKMKNTILTETGEIIEMLELLCKEMENQTIIKTKAHQRMSMGLNVVAGIGLFDQRSHELVAKAPWFEPFTFSVAT